MRRGKIEPQVLVEIYLSASNVRRFVSGDQKYLGYPNLVNECSSFSTSIDPTTREPDYGDITLTFAEHAATRKLCSQRIKGKKIVISLGESSLTNAADWQSCPLFTGIADDPVLTKEDTIELKISGALHFAKTVTLTGNWTCRHPLTIYKSLFNYVCPPEFYDAASFSPYLFPNTMSHWNTARAVHGEYDRSVSKPTDALALMAELGRD